MSGAFALADTIFAFILIFLHLRNYHRPEFQRYYVRIILMIPVYAIVSWYLIFFMKIPLTSLGWDTDFIVLRRIMNLDEIHMRLSLCAVS